MQHRICRLLRSIHRVDVFGLERVPPDGRVIMALNHCGVRGAFVFQSLIPRDIVFLASHRFLRLPLVGRIASLMSALYVSQADVLRTRILDEAADLMRGGSLLGVMVSGRQMAGTQGIAKRGVAWLAYRLGADILPVSVIKHGLNIRIDVGARLPPPQSVNAHALEETLDDVCRHLRCVM